MEDIRTPIFKVANSLPFIRKLTVSVPRKRVVIVHVELSPLHKLAYNEFCKECLSNVNIARGGCLGLLTSLRYADLGTQEGYYFKPSRHQVHS